MSCLLFQSLGPLQLFSPATKIYYIAIKVKITIDNLHVSKCQYSTTSRSNLFCFSTAHCMLTHCLSSSIQPCLNAMIFPRQNLCVLHHFERVPPHIFIRICNSPVFLQHCWNSFKLTLQRRFMNDCSMLLDLTKNICEVFP